MFLKMKPVCDCGFMLNRLEVGVNPVCMEDKRMTPTYIPQVTISPKKCPGCGLEIEGVQYQVPVDNNLEYDEKKYCDGERKQ